VTYQFAISPDVHARDLSAWFVLNTRLQRATGQAIHATAYDDFAALHTAYDAGRVDLVYANAADTVLLVRRHGFLPVARPVTVADEAAVVVAHGGPLARLDDLIGHDDGGQTLSVAATDAPDVERICRILLEPADLGPHNITISRKRNYVLVAKAVLTGQAQAGFLLREAYDSLSAMIHKDLHILISSRIYVVSHCLLASPAAAGLVEPVRTTLEAMGGTPQEKELLAGLGAPSGWQPTTDQETEFMIDLMAALEQ
jgi:phosphonate transport system substrate-binding protein